MTGDGALERPLRVIAPVNLSAGGAPWVGDKEELRGLLVDFERAAAEVRVQLLAELQDDDDGWLSSRRREQVRSAWTPEFDVTEVSPARHLFGGAHEVIEAMNPKAVVAVEAKCGDGYASLQLQMNAAPARFYDKEGAEIKIASEDAGWARKWHATFDAQLRNAKPWWGPLRSPNGSFLLSILVAGLVNLGILSYVSLGPMSAGKVIVLIFNLSIYTALLGFLIQSGIKRLLPPFQLLKVGQRDRGHMAIVILTTPLLAVAWNIVAYFLTS